LDDAIQDKLAHLDGIIAAKNADMDAIVDHLTEDFLIEFWKTVQEAYAHVSYYERQGLIWKALYQKDAFIAGIDAIRNWLAQGLADTRATLVSELNAERTAMAGFIAAQRTTYTDSNNTFKADLAGTVSTSRATVGASIDEKNQYLDDNNANDEGGKLEQYVYDLATVQYSPTGAGHTPGTGYQPYAKWVANDLQD